MGVAESKECMKNSILSKDEKNTAWANLLENSMGKEALKTPTIRGGREESQNVELT